MNELKTVLVAEDNEVDALLFRRAFANAEVSATLQFVPDGVEGIAYLKGEAGYADRKAHPLPHLMVLDLRMPRLNGFDVLDWLRKQEGLRRLPVIILTSSDLPIDINRSYDLGANAYLVKPNDPAKMSDVMKRLQEFWLNTNCGPESLIK
jgi:CheY-like chemotaxis protein